MTDLSTYPRLYSYDRGHKGDFGVQQVLPTQPEKPGQFGKETVFIGEGEGFRGVLFQRMQDNPDKRYIYVEEAKANGTIVASDDPRLLPFFGLAPFDAHPAHPEALKEELCPK